MQWQILSSLKLILNFYRILDSIIWINWGEVGSKHRENEQVDQSIFFLRHSKGIGRKKWVVISFAILPFVLYITHPRVMSRVGIASPCAQASPDSAGCRLWDVPSTPVWRGWLIILHDICHAKTYTCKTLSAPVLRSCH